MPNPQPQLIAHEFPSIVESNQMRMDAVTAKRTTAGWTSRPIKSRGTPLMLSTSAAARELPKRAMRRDGKIEQVPHPKAPKVPQPKGHGTQQLHQRPNHEQVNT